MFPFENVLLFCEPPHGSQEKNKSTLHGEKQTQMISLVQALKFYGTAALRSVKGQSLDMPELQVTTMVQTTISYQSTLDTHSHGQQVH